MIDFFDTRKKTKCAILFSLFDRYEEKLKQRENIQRFWIILLSNLFLVHAFILTSYSCQNCRSRLPLRHVCQLFGLTWPTSYVSCHDHVHWHPVVWGHNSLWRGPMDYFLCAPLLFSYGTTAHETRCSVCVIRSGPSALFTTIELLKLLQFSFHSSFLLHPSFDCGLLT